MAVRLCCGTWLGIDFLAALPGVDPLACRKNCDDLVTADGGVLRQSRGARPAYGKLLV
jgi:hypothetical protein